MKIHKIIVLCLASALLTVVSYQAHAAITCQVVRCYRECHDIACPDVCSEGERYNLETPCQDDELAERGLVASPEEDEVGPTPEEWGEIKDECKDAADKACEKVNEESPECQALKEKCEAEYAQCKEEEAAQLEECWKSQGSGYRGYGGGRQK